MSNESERDKALGELASLSQELGMYDNNGWIKFDQYDESTWPVIGRRVIAFDKDGYGSVSARHSVNGWYIECYIAEGKNVTHWQPLPEPPKD